MIDIPTLTPQLLEELGRELGGCDFTGPNQQAFLAAADSRDVQAAPGNGKTTLLVAKLALLSRTWHSRGEGVCVISHTNAAREEVEARLYDHPAASAFLTYPHFVGTVTSFIDRFIALPYLRGLGWRIQRIDDDIFAAVALSRWRSKQALVRYAHRQEHALLRYIENLELAESFDCECGARPERLSVRRLQNQPGPTSQTGIALEELKAEVVNEGFYRFGDMLALAEQALRNCPSLVNRLRTRFPLVLLDEAQDTNGSQLALLERVFGDGVAYQRLGDENQTLYENDALGPDDYWQAAENVIPLNSTRRFGPEIAQFSSRLTARAPQQIESRIDRPSRRTLILFDDFEIRNVLPVYAEEVAANWGRELNSELDIRAVASRHSPTRDRTGGWPKTLVDYCPTYPGRGYRSQRMSDRLCIGAREASALLKAGRRPAEVSNLIRSLVVQLLRLQGVTTATGGIINSRNLWEALRDQHVEAPNRVQRLFRDRVLLGMAPWSRDAWADFCAELFLALVFDGGPTDSCSTYLGFVPGTQMMRMKILTLTSARTHSLITKACVFVGSIHSVKGRTVDALLAVETEVYRGRALADRAMDLETVLPTAFGLESRNFNETSAQLAAATNVFVAATRPRFMLALAMRREAASAELVWQLSSRAGS